MNRIQLLLSTSLMTCAVTAPPAFAQTDASVSEASKASQEIQEVVVTAERRFNTAQRTAAAVSVRSGDDMLLQGRYELKNILEDVPGVVGGAAASVSTSQAGGSDNPATGLTIRGIQSNSGAGGSSITTAAAAAIYVDDVYNGIGGNYDLDRVEVLRGPQGTLYGRSATAGVVATHTRDPDSKGYSAEGAAEFGNYDMRHLTGGVNLPVVEDKLAVRLAGNLFERDGYYSAKGGALSSKDFRAKALWTPTENFSATLGYALQYNVNHTGGVQFTQVSPGEFRPADTTVGTGKNHFHQYWGQFNLDLGPVAITYIPAYRTWYQNSTVVARSTFFNADQTIFTPDDTFQTHELRIRSTATDSKFKWQAGFLYYENNLSNVNNLFNVDTQSYLYKDSAKKSTTATGGFAEGTYEFTPETRLTAGIRYDHTKVLTTQTYTSLTGETKSLTGDEGRRTFNNITYKARLEHDLTPRNLMYASISTGFSPGDVTLTTDANFRPAVQTLDSETLTAYEIGSKNRFFDNHLQVNGAAFYYDYSGYQTAGINTSPETPATPTFVTISVPMKSYGAELEVQARPWDDGTISFNASYTRARYGDFGQWAEFFSKKTVPGVAPFQGTAAYDHRFVIGDSTLVLRGAVRFFSAHDTERLTQEQARYGAGPYVRVGSQAVADLNATLLLGSNYTITAYVRNLTDNRFTPDGWNVSSAVDPNTVPAGTNNVSSTGAALSDPRTFGVILGFKF